MCHFKLEDDEDHEDMQIDSSESLGLDEERAYSTEAEMGGNIAKGEAGEVDRQTSLKEGEEGGDWLPGQLSESQLEELDDLTSGGGNVDPDLIDRSWVDKMWSQGKEWRGMKGQILVVGDSMLRSTDTEKYQDRCEDGFGINERLERDLGDGKEIECLARGGASLGCIHDQAMSRLRGRGPDHLEQYDVVLIHGGVINLMAGRPRVKSEAIDW